MKNIEKKVVDIIEGKKKAPVAKALLKVMSKAYQGGVSLRHFAYDHFLPTVKLPMHVISVGNIVAGGTGKTPFVHYLAKQLSEEKNVSILSRGYRRKTKHHLLVQQHTTAEQAGDEPYLLAKKLPNVNVIVGKDRSLSGQLAKSLGSEVLILDDGMQHRKVERDIEIGVMHADDLFGKGFYLPMGYLRDSPKRLANADLIIVNGVKDEEHFEAITPLIRNLSDAPITAMQLKVENSHELASKKVASFCAIANPTRFYNTLKTLGCDIIEKQEKLDHLPFTVEELEQLANRVKNQGAEILVCTEKDLVKLPEKIQLALPLIPVRIALTPTFGKEHLKTFIEKEKQR